MASPTASQGNLGAGQQDPFDSNSEVGIALFLAKQVVNKLQSMIPVQVKTVHAGSGSPPAAPTVDVQLLVSQLDGSGNAVQPGIVSGLPVYRVQGGPWAVICDPVAGDFGFIIAADRDISKVIGSPGIQSPGSYRKYSYSDAFYLGGALNKVPQATLWLKGDGTFNLTTKDGVVVQSDGSGNLNMTCGTLAVTGNITATGDITGGQGGADQVGLRTHVHGGVTTGGGFSVAPRPGS